MALTARVCSAGSTWLVSDIAFPPEAARPRPHDVKAALSTIAGPHGWLGRRRVGAGNAPARRAWERRSTHLDGLARHGRVRPPGQVAHLVAPRLLGGRQLERAAVGDVGVVAPVALGGARGHDGHEVIPVAGALPEDREALTGDHRLGRLQARGEGVEADRDAG